MTRLDYLEAAVSAALLRRVGSRPVSKISLALGIRPIFPGANDHAADPATASVLITGTASL